MTRRDDDDGRGDGERRKTLLGLDPDAMVLGRPPPMQLSGDISGGIRWVVSVAPNDSGGLLELAGGGPPSKTRGGSVEVPGRWSSSNDKSSPTFRCGLLRPAVGGGLRGKGRSKERSRRLRRPPGVVPDMGSRLR